MALRNNNINQNWQNFTNTNFITNLVVLRTNTKHKFGSIFGWLRRKAVTVTVAFTMAEILLSLTIIGVVAAITLPSLTGNINEKTWNTQRKALYSRLSQAISMMPALNGYGQYQGTWSADSVTATVDTAAEMFVTEGLAKVLKINNICDNQHFQDCGINAKIKTMAGPKITFPKKLSQLNPIFTKQILSTFINPQKHIDTKAIAFETQNGESIVVYYNPFCQANFMEISSHYAQSKMCANFIYDLNGLKGPNTFGKDIGFITALYPTNSSIVAPDLYNIKKSGFTWEQAYEYCKSLDGNGILPNYEEAAAILYNNKLIDSSNIYAQFWTRTTLSGNKAWNMAGQAGRFYNDGKTISLNGIHCVKHQ